MSGRESERPTLAAQHNALVSAAIAGDLSAAREISEMPLGEWRNGYDEEAEAAARRTLRQEGVEPDETTLRERIAARADVFDTYWEGRPALFRALQDLVRTGDAINRESVAKRAAKLEGVSYHSLLGRVDASLGVLHPPTPPSSVLPTPPGPESEQPGTRPDELPPALDGLAKTFKFTHEAIRQRLDRATEAGWSLTRWPAVKLRVSWALVHHTGAIVRLFDGTLPTSGQEYLKLMELGDWLGIESARTDKEKHTRRARVRAAVKKLETLGLVSTRRPFPGLPTWLADDEKWEHPKTNSPNRFLVTKADKAVARSIVRPEQATVAERRAAADHLSERVRRAVSGARRGRDGELPEAVVDLEQALLAEIDTLDPDRK